MTATRSGCNFFVTPYLDLKTSRIIKLVSFYFTINTPKKTTVLNIGRTSNSFSKVFTKEDFLFTNSTLDKLDYNLIQSQQ